MADRSGGALGKREPTAARPFGYGQERYLWTFMTAVGMFLAGSIFAIGFGAYELLRGEGETEGFEIAYAVLAIAAVAEGTSWLRALRQTKAEAKETGKPTFAYARESRDPNVKMVLFEDSAALIGIAIATIGIALNEITGATFWDPLASVLIGLLLVTVAVTMGRDAKHLLIGSAARPEERKRLEEVSSEIDRDLREAVPDVTEVFIDATPGRGDSDACRGATPLRRLPRPSRRRTCGPSRGSAWPT